MKGFSRFVGCVAGASLTLGLFACGDTVENTTINQMGMEVVDSEDDLPECGKENEGELAFVKDEDASRVCVGGDWKPVSSNGSGDFSCKTVELKDGSGLKIVCNGDSIGVVLNGSDGKAGKDGKDGADGEDGEDGKDAVLPQDTLEADSERVAISLDSLTGFTQKGPFLKGSTVYLYELSDGRTLKQTNGNFTSKITSDDGRYKFSARDLVSQYAMVVVDGYYRNEVTGGTSDAPIRLTALTDMRKRSSVNVNLLTHMEFDRVYNLVTHGDSTGKKLTVKAAKRQAQKEILKQFHIELGENTDAEDMDVFGDSDADAALLAVSVLLQGDSSSSALSVLLTEISNDISGYGEWKNKATKAKLADWALTVDLADSTSKLSLFGKNVTDWGLGDAPDFAKFVRNFASAENRLGVCGSKDAPEGIVKEVSNPKSEKYYASKYADKSKTDVRFICRKEGDLYVWRAATDIEKDTMSFGHEYSKGDVRQGLIDSNLAYVYENGNWRHGTYLDGKLGLGCIKDREDTVASIQKGDEPAKNDDWYKCADTTMQYVLNGVVESEWKSAWRKASDIEMDTATWGHSAREGETRKGSVNENLIYVYEKGDWRHGTELDGILQKGCILDRIDTLMKVSGKWYKCVDSTMQYVADGFIESELHSAWRPIEGAELDSNYWALYRNSSGTLLTGPFSGDTLVWDADTLRKPNELEIELKKGCVSYMRGGKYEVWNSLYYDCNDAGWSKTGTFTDYRDGKTYKGVLIGTQTWMAENLNYEMEKSYCYKDSTKYCDMFGRLYLWSAAMDSTGRWGSGGKGCGYGTECYPTGRIRGACPSGWHLPDSTEWSVLVEYVGGVDSAGKMLKSQSGWLTFGYAGVDAYSFTALAAGERQSDGQYANRQAITYFWSATEWNISWGRADEANGIYFSCQSYAANLYHGKKSFGSYVRCVQD